MALNRIQRLFVRLASNQQSKVSQRWNKNTRRKKIFGSWSTVSVPTTVKVEIISAITGEVTTARAHESSVLKLKKWLKMRNVRAQFSEMVVKKNSIWEKLFVGEYKDYPVLVRVGTLKVPYLLEHIGGIYKKGKCNVVTVFLKTIGNADYLSLVLEHKETLKNLPKSLKGKKKK